MKWQRDICHGGGYSKYLLLLLSSVTGDKIEKLRHLKCNNVKTDSDQRMGSFAEITSTETSRDVVEL